MTTGGCPIKLWGLPEPDQRTPSRRELQGSSIDSIASALEPVIPDDPSFEFVECGEFHFKGVLGEHAVYALRWERA